MVKGPVLFVDDEMLIMGSFIHILEEKHDFFVIPYDNANDAIYAIQREGIDYKVALIDRSMAEPGGEEVMKASKERHPHVPVICLSGHDERNNLPYANTHIVKPLDTERLVQTIDDYLRG